MTETFEIREKNGTHVVVGTSDGVETAYVPREPLDEIKLSAFESVLPFVQRDARYRVQVGKVEEDTITSSLQANTLINLDYLGWTPVFTRMLIVEKEQRWTENYGPCYYARFYTPCAKPNSVLLSTDYHFPKEKKKARKIIRNALIKALTLKDVPVEP